MDVTCNVIEDLLPIYADGICSEDTKTIIEHHTAVCPECREKLEAMTSALEKNEKKGKVDNPFKKVKNHYLRLVTVTLLVCALFVLPFGGAGYLFVNEYFDNGYSWSSFTTDIKLHKMSRMLKQGKYRDFLDCFEFYTGKAGSYSAEELDMYRNMFAEDFETYFNNNKIKYINVQADEGKCEGGQLGILTEYMETIVMEFSAEEDGQLYFAMYDPKSYFTGLPCMNLLYKNSVFDYFELLRDREKLVSAVMFNQTAENREIFDEDLSTHFKNTENKYVEMLNKYSYIGCETGDIAYRRELLEFNEYDHIWRYFSQETVLKMSGKDCGEFTVSFDTAVSTTSFPMQEIINVDNIVYSDNTPEDFKTMFEDIFS